MKKKQPVHPKLYLKKIEKNDTIEIEYIQNSFNSEGERSIKTKIINNSHKVNLFKENMKQLEILTNYIKIQKRVLEKHKKSRNYDAVKVLKQSILYMKEFEKKIDNWFVNNREII